MKRNGPTRKSTKAPAFVLRAERALRRAAKNVQAQNRTLKLPGDCLAGRQRGGETCLKTSRCKYAAEQGIAEEEALKKGSRLAEMEADPALRVPFAEADVEQMFKEIMDERAAKTSSRLR